MFGRGKTPGSAQRQLPLYLCRVMEVCCQYRFQAAIIYRSTKHSESSWVAATGMTRLTRRQPRSSLHNPATDDNSVDGDNHPQHISTYAPQDVETSQTTSVLRCFQRKTERSDSHTHVYKRNSSIKFPQNATS